ncbi:MAG: DNA-3-methyladenine glycosylase [Dehalococcoidia bacterium]|nr:DNA-3-methyladenine glycosylase [Dehalococcoidia bacterium]
MSTVRQDPPVIRSTALRGDVLPASFYTRPTLRVARALLGKILVHRSRIGSAAGRIVEVEAYRGIDDRAAHTAGGRRTMRNEVMWGPGGHLYVYFIYGMHYCCNVVTRTAGVPEAVLLRALEPIVGLDLMRRRRKRCDVPAWALARGPGNLCRALGIDLRNNGCDLTTGPIVLLDAPRLSDAAIAASPRIGVAYAGDHALRPWRFFVRTSPAVSGQRSGTALNRP